MTQQWCLAWSPSQDCLHVEPVADMLKRNQEAFIAERPGFDYVMLAAGDEQTMRTAAADLRLVMLKRKTAHIEARTVMLLAASEETKSFAQAFFGRSLAAGRKGGEGTAA